MNYTAQYDAVGHFAGVTDADGNFIRPGPTEAWNRFVAWNAANGDPIDTFGKRAAHPAVPPH